MSEYTELKKTIGEKMEALKQEMLDLGKQFFKEETDSIFADYPNLKSFVWHQYTPYFNDGDECTFSVYDAFNLNFYDEVDPDEDEDGNYFDYDREISVWNFKHYPDESSQGGRVTLDLVQRVEEIVTGIDDDVMKQLFGDHVSVAVSREGVNTEHYEHD